MPHKDSEVARAWRRQWWANLSPERKAEKQAKANARATDLRRYLDGVKMHRGCLDCGYRGHPAALDFDHVSGQKALLVSSCKSRAQADIEIAKCEVRCANCHRIKSWERRWVYLCKPDIFEATYDGDGYA
jgi:hypothetical protein